MQDFFAKNDTNCAFEKFSPQKPYIFKLNSLTFAKFLIKQASK